MRTRRIARAIAAVGVAVVFGSACTATAAGLACAERGAGVHRGTAQPSDRELLARFDRAEAAGRDRDALAAAVAITDRHPESAFWRFNLARVHARLGHADEAIAALRRSADLGFTGIASFEQHADLNPLRDRDDFAEIIAVVRANAAARFDAFKAEAREHEPPTFVPEGLDPGGKPPVVLALHGTGGTGERMLAQLRRVCEDLGVVCIAPDALRPAGDGFSWTYRDEAAWFVEHLIEQAITEHNADPDRVILLGFSQGANIALTMARTHADELHAVIPICGHYEPAVVGGGAAGAKADRAPAPAYLLHGSRDPWHDTYDAAFRDFTAAGARATRRVISGMPHTMPSRRELKRALEWSLDPED